MRLNNKIILTGMINSFVTQCKKKYFSKIYCALKIKA